MRSSASGWSTTFSHSILIKLPRKLQRSAAWWRAGFKRSCCQSGNAIRRSSLHRRLPELGFEKIKFHLPVAPGATIHVKVAVTGRRVSQSRPNVGIVNWHLETIDQDNRVVMTMDMSSLIKRNHA